MVRIKCISIPTCSEQCLDVSLNINMSSLTFIITIVIITTTSSFQTWSTGHVERKISFLCLHLPIFLTAHVLLAKCTLCQHFSAPLSISGDTFPLKTPKVLSLLHFLATLDK